MKQYTLNLSAALPLLSALSLSASFPALSDTTISEKTSLAAATSSEPQIHSKQIESTTSDSVVDNSTSSRYQQSFDALMQNPSDPALSFQFAKNAIDAKDLSGAISAFERMLMIDSNLDNIRLELGVLYLRVGAHELAGNYINDALNSPDIPIDVKTRAKRLHQLALEEQSPHTLSFNIGIGTHYDDNATAAPDSREVLVGGFTALLDEEDTGQDDTSASLSLSMSHAYAFNSQSGSQLETRASIYSKRYDEANDIDLDYLALQIGPRYYLGPILNPSWSVSPFIALNQLNLDQEKYQRSTDAGINVQRLLGSQWMLGSTVQFSDHEYYDSDLRTTAAERSGDGYSLSFDLSRTFTPALSGSVTTSFVRRNAEVEYETKDEASLYLSVKQRYTAPFGIPQRWSTSLSLSYTDIGYKAPDDAIDPNTKREDERLQTRLSNALIFNQRYYATVDLFYSDVDSSLPNFVYDNTGINITFWASF